MIGKTAHFKTNKGGFYYVPEFDAGTADVFFFLALFLIQLVFCILVKLKLMPVLIYLACANLIFPEWVAAHQLLYRAILAGLVLITVFRWVGPKLIEHLEEKRIMQSIVEQSRWAEAMGYRTDQINFEVKDGMPQIKINQQARDE